MLQSIQDEYGFEIVTYDESANMYEDVKTGNSIAAFDDYPVLAYGVKQGNGLKIVTDKEAGNSYGFAVSKGENAELLQMFNTGLTNLRASGEYQEILDQYLETGSEEVSRYRFLRFIKRKFSKFNVWFTNDFNFNRCFLSDCFGPWCGLRIIPSVKK